MKRECERVNFADRNEHRTKYDRTQVGEWSGINIGFPLAMESFVI
jgi:hypothetical protein